MSTRCMINFGSDGVTDARIYRHSDGYPEAVLPDLAEFFGEVRKQTSDTRFGDPEYLAAKYVVWQANQNTWHYKGAGRYEKGDPLDFISLGVTLEDHGDCEYIYTIRCGTYDGNGNPTIVMEEV